MLEYLDREAAGIREDGERAPAEPELARQLGIAVAFGRIQIGLGHQMLEPPTMARVRPGGSRQR